MAEQNHSEPLAGLPRGLNILLTLAGSVIVVAGLRSFADMVGPVFLALVVVVVVSPVQGALIRRGAPTWVATVALFLSAFGVLAAIVLALVWAAAELAGLVTSDTYSSQLQQTRDDLVDWLEELGVAGGELESVLDVVDIGTVAGELTSALSGVLGLLSSLSLLVFTLVFVVMDASKFERNLRYVARDRGTVAEALRQFASSTRSYFIVSSVFGLIVAVFDVLALVALGIPLALVWGVLSFITNYIPNIGFVIGLIPPAVLAFFQGGWQLSLAVVVIYSVLNVVIQSIIQPRYVGDAVGLSVTLTFISLIFWGWVLGPLGALLAIPLTLLVKALLIDIDPTTKWAAPLITLDKPPEEALVAGRPPDGEDGSAGT
ncbi:MAG: AI-2E family transporter [Acidimicrobiales bacterium]